MIDSPLSSFSFSFVIITQVTTSTCSGRISVFCQSPTENVEQNHLDETVSRKTTGKWLIVSHEIVQIDDVYQSVQEYLQSRSEQEAVRKIYYNDNFNLLLIECT